mgnify:CR=1 FL=1
MESADLLSLALSLESRSDHPLADAIVRYAREKNAQKRSVTDFEMLEGQGIRAFVDGVPCFAGNRRMLLANGLALSGSMQKLGDEFAAAGKTPLFFAANRQMSVFLRSLMCSSRPVRRQSKHCAVCTLT